MVDNNNTIRMIFCHQLNTAEIGVNARKSTKGDLVLQTLS